MSFTFTCPFCHQTMTCEDDWDGMGTQCPICEESITLTPPASEEPLSPVVMTYSSDNEPPPEEGLGAWGKFFTWLGGFSIWCMPILFFVLWIVRGSLKSRRPDLAKSMLKWELIGVASPPLLFLLFLLFCAIFGFPG